VKHILTIWLTALLALFGGVARSADGVTPRQVLIGQTITLQGGKNEYGKAVLAGVEAYLQSVNSRGGVNGRTVALKVLDDNNQSATAEANARQLITQDKVFILFGSIEGGPSTAVMKAAVDLNVPFFGPMAGSPTLRRPHQPLVFPVRAEHRDEFRALLNYAKSTGVSRVAFLRSDSETGLLHLENVKNICRELGLELTKDLPFKSDVGDSQLDEMASSLVANRVQVVFNHGGIGVYERLIRRARAQNVRTAFFGVNSGSAQLVKQLGNLATGMVFAQVLPSPWERKRGVVREYQEEFKRQNPGQQFSYGSLEGYLTAKAMVFALRAAGPNPTRESFVAGLTNAKIDLDGLIAQYSSGVHAGMSLVDLALVDGYGRFRH
jgi:branched-chain amino acid transport system substrate-binding protein